MSNAKAFPFVIPADEHNGTVAYMGMDLRDYFAAKAMQGLLSNPKLHEEILKMGQSWIYDSSYAIANKMMEIRKK
jgi:hypothetical protein